MLMLLYLGGFETSEAVATYRKLANTTVELANVAAQYNSMSATDVTSVMNASSQIMAPYPTQNLSIVLSEITTDSSGNPTVTWSRPYHGAQPLTSVILPTGMATPNTNYILVQTSYLYVPTVGSAFVGSVPMSDQIYMLPRQSSSIPYTG